MPSALHEIVDALKKTPEMVSHLVEGLSDLQLRLKNSADEFSALENVCHLRDIEVEGYSRRIARILTEKNPSLPDINGSRLAEEHNYNQQSLSHALEAFTVSRQNNIRTLQGLTPDQTNREGALEGFGTISLHRLLEMMLEHDESHIGELEVICRRFARQRAEDD